MQDGFDRDTGEGVGHLFKLNMKGNLIADLTLGEGSMYHPGGIDYDGQSIWVPVAEYRPNSRAITYWKGLTKTDAMDLVLLLIESRSLEYSRLRSGHQLVVLRRRQQMPMDRGQNSTCRRSEPTLTGPRSAL